MYILTYARGGNCNLERWQYSRDKRIITVARIAQYYNISDVQLEKNILICFFFFIESFKLLL